MADQAVVHIGENSPEQVAYRLTRDIMIAENRQLGEGGKARVDRKWLLDTYGECLQAVKGYRDWEK